MKVQFQLSGASYHFQIQVARTEGNGELESFGAGYWLSSWSWILALTIYLT